jgi:pSer/pThr/pTyr-binding forkhead associated (FHA) protein
VRLVGPGVDLNVTAPGGYEIGRLSEVALRIVHPTVSRRQARLTLSSDRTTVRLEHTGSSPTLVNGRVLTEAATLADGDQVQLGEVTLAVRFE